MIFVYRLTAGQERVVADVLFNKIRKEKIPIYSIAMLEEWRGYLIVEADDELSVRQAAMRIPHIKGVLSKSMDMKDIEAHLESKPIGTVLNKGDIVELVSGPFKGEKARVIKIDENKEEVTVELTEVAVPIPVTVRAGTVRIFKKAEDV
ncbi:MAG: transcription elongation factor Spt5 [Candidatus Micrarchaeota archaeon]